MIGFYRAILAPRIASFFRAQSTTVAATFKAQYEAQKADRGTLRKDAAIDALDWDGLIAVISPVLESTYKTGATRSAQDLNLSPFNRINEAALEYARQRGAELVGKKYVNGELVDNPNAEWVITDTTRSDLQGLIEQALQDGWSPDELARQITELIDDSARADMIAATEVAMAQSQGSLDEWRQSGVVHGKVWILSGDHSDPDECDDNDGEEVALDDVFPSGDDAPPLHPNCACSVAAVVSEN